MSRRFAALIPFYDYDEAHFFNADGAPAQIAVQRRDGFFKLAALYAQRFVKTARATSEVAPEVADLQFTSRYRVPFQFSRIVRQNLSAGSFLQSKFMHVGESSKIYTGRHASLGERPYPPFSKKLSSNFRTSNRSRSSFCMGDLPSPPSLSVFGNRPL